MAKVKIKIYKWGGKFGPFKIKTTCGECSLSINIIHDVAKEFGNIIEIEEVPWLDNWHRVIKKGGWHAPIITVNEKVISQGVVIDRDYLRSVLVKRIYKDFKIGVLLKMARENAGLTQEQVAQKLSTKKSAISRIENHAEDIRLSTIERFAEAVGKRIELNIV